MDDRDAPDSRMAANSVFQFLDRELWLVTTRGGERRGGLIATFVSKASIVPDMPRMLVGLAKRHYTCGLVRDSGRFAMHLLWPNQLDLVERFGLATGHEGDKFAGMTTGTTPLGNPLVGSTLAWVDCSVETTFDIGDRILFVGRVEHGQHRGRSVPLSVNRLYDEAPPHMRDRLEAMYEHDGRADAEAIRAWRGDR